MAVNRHRPHLIVYVEDDANRDICLGFIESHLISHNQIQIKRPFRGWPNVLGEVKKTGPALLADNDQCHLVAVIDLDNDLRRKSLFEEAIPEALKDRFFVLSSWDEPEKLKLGMSFLEIGQALAEDCAEGKVETWGLDGLKHNLDELKRMNEAIRSFILQSN